MKTVGRVFCLAIALLVSTGPANARGLPPALLRQLPANFVVLASTQAAGIDGHDFYFVVLAARGEARARRGGEDAPQRPLLIFERHDDSAFRLAGRNDTVVLRASDGGFNGCDPFEERHIAVKGRYFTVENGVACGAHWTDYVTFRFDPRSGGYVFDNHRFHNWVLNPSNSPDADALVEDGSSVTRARGAIPFARWRRSDK